MFDIRIDPELALVEVKLEGMMPAAEVTAYIAELRRQFVIHRLRSYAMVIDVSDCPIQSQQTVQELAGHMATMPKARAIAVVTGSSLARMQVRRLFTQPYARIAASVGEGRAWVLDQVEPQLA